MRVHAEIRKDAARAGVELGWLSVVAVGLALALGAPAQSPHAVIALTVVAAAANGAVALLWARLPGRGALLADVWTGGLMGFATLLVLLAGAEGGWSVLWFVIAPFVTVVHGGRRRMLWLGAIAVSFAGTMALAPERLELGVVALQAVLLCGSVLLAVRLGALVNRQAEARAEATARAELEQALLAEAHHRVKNSLQTIADLLMLGRPSEGGEAFDRTAERIRSIAAVHHLLASGGGQSVRADELLGAVIAAAAADAGAVELDADPVRLPAAEAQHLGIAANELLANALEHGRPPVRVTLRGAPELRLSVEDAGAVVGASNGGGLGLQLVRRIAEQGLHGDFSLDADGGSTIASLRAPVPCA